jgi:hypothetical protein
LKSCHGKIALALCFVSFCLVRINFLWCFVP